MYISKVTLAQYPKLRPTKLHAYVEDLFTDRLRHLWQVSEIKGLQTLIILSRNKPQFDQAFIRPLTFQTKSFDSVLSSLKDGLNLRFKLDANPLCKPARDRQSALDPNDQRDWLLHIAKHSGFDIKALSISHHTWVKVAHRGNHTFQFAKVTFTGILQITDSELFEKALLTGFGREKAYGMGLMLLGLI